MKRRRILPRIKGAGESGQTLVEFALVSIIFFMFVFALFDGTRLFQSWVTVQHAARTGARYAVTGQITCEWGTSRNECITDTAKNATTGINGGGVDSSRVTVTTKYWDYPSYSGSGTTGTGVQCDAVEVRVAYTHQFVVPFFTLIAPGGVSIAGSQRMVNEPFGPCT